MVPCQPRQLVILSLPFAALVAFFWYKRRKSLSRSDPGGTLQLTKPLDNTATSSVSESDIKVLNSNEFDKKVVRESFVPEIKKVCNSPSKPEEVSEENIHLTVNSLLKSEKTIDEPIKSQATNNSVKSIPAINKKDIISNGTAVHFKDQPEILTTLENDIENHSINPNIHTNRVFHSTFIEDEEEIEEIKDDSPVKYSKPVEESIQSFDIQELELVGDIECSKSVKEEKETERNPSNIRPTLEEQSTLENIALKHKIILNETSVTPKRSSETVTSSDDVLVKIDLTEKDVSSTISDTVERFEEISTDTGLGSQDPSAVEDSSTNMAQGQKTEEKTQNNATGLEHKLASLGLDTQQPAQRTERDSANHSPAEVMLNSPAISTFSDAHSEGSSDSGKGCSDVVTPPSRTPAGGSSVAGDQVPSVYEFVLPQVIVGRLIGRHGAFLHDIRAKTHTNVFIKRHPETNSLKICAIEGTQQDIDAALKMIRQKFPLRRFPDLTLERVSFVKSPCLPISPENLQLHLVEGVNNDVLLSSLITAGHFFLQLPTHYSYQSLYRLACFMNTVYNTQESPPLQDPLPDVVCVAPAHGGWYRAQILSVDEEANTSDIRFLDYGGFLTVDNNLLRQIRGDFLLLPFQAVECALANVVPAGGEGEWTEEARQFVQLMTTNQTLQAQVYDYTETGLPLVYLYCTQFYQSPSDPSGYETKVVLLNQELVSRGYADLIDASQEEGQTTATESS